MPREYYLYASEANVSRARGQVYEGEHAQSDATVPTGYIAQRLQSVIKPLQIISQLDCMNLLLPSPATEQSTFRNYHK